MATMVEAIRVGRHEVASVSETVANAAGHANVVKNILLFFAAPFIGLAYITAFPFIGVAVIVKSALGARG